MAKDAGEKPVVARVIGGLALLVVGTALGVVVIVGAVTGARAAFTALPVHPFDGPAVVAQLDKEATLGLWAARDSQMTCTVRDGAGAVVPVRWGSDSSQAVGDDALLGTFQATEAGWYTVTCQGNGAGFRVNPPLAPGGMVNGAIGGTGLILLSVIGGAALAWWGIRPGRVDS